MFNFCATEEKLGGEALSKQRLYCVSLPWQPRESKARLGERARDGEGAAAAAAVDLRTSARGRSNVSAGLESGGKAHPCFKSPPLLQQGRAVI